MAPKTKTDKGLAAAAFVAKASPTTQDKVPKVATRVDAPEEPTQQPDFSAAAGKVEAAAGKVAVEQTVPSVMDMRKAQIDELPTIGQVTKMKPAVEECNIFIIPAASGAAAAAAINETTKTSDVQRLGDLLWEQMDKVTCVRPGAEGASTSRHEAPLGR